MLLYRPTPLLSKPNAGALPPAPLGFTAFVSVGNGNHWYHCRQPWLVVAPKDYRFPTKRGDTNWYRPPQTRYGAHVASQRCTILRSGKAIILCWNTQLMATPKTQIVLDMGYTLVLNIQEVKEYICIFTPSQPTVHAGCSTHKLR